jgi:hypothetical protein
MANPNRQDNPEIKRSEQGVLNNSFDEQYQVLATEMLVENEAGTALVRLNESNFGGSSSSTGMCADWIGISENSTWASETVIQDGRYIYSMRGGAGALIDRFDIAGGTAGAGAWTAVTYIGTETFTTGSSAFQSGEWLYIRKDATNRFFKYSVVKNVMFPFNTNTYTDGVAVLGQKIWVKSLDSTENVRWVYSLQNTGTALHRIMII